MHLNIRVQPNAKQNKIVKEKDRFKVYLTAPPVEGKANQALTKDRLMSIFDYAKMKDQKDGEVNGERIYC